MGQAEEEPTASLLHTTLPDALSELLGDRTNAGTKS